MHLILDGSSVRPTPHQLAGMGSFLLVLFFGRNLAIDMKFPLYMSGNTVETTYGNCFYCEPQQTLVYCREISCQMPADSVITY